MRKPKQCFLNARKLAWKSPDRYVYVEGWASTPTFAMLHAWRYDRQAGLIVDQTWKDGSDYVGVPIRAKYVGESIGPYCGSLIEDWERDYPLVTGAFLAKCGRNSCETSWVMLPQP